ncbi:hypothetical protein AVEN_116311-1 [Araneus ventricosus]|uniref:Uncharacterized protein n=1 Tax=Araneus ventricosus TaxID=182803 RepID=A0A4Y2JIZ7_ARAVE|nr:hypothetical protein AVEN_116311-1 [Araneus ventricosus]
MEWNILWTDEAHFHLQSFVISQNCRILARENPFQMQPLPIHSQKVPVWCGFTEAFIDRGDARGRDGVNCSPSVTAYPPPPISERLRLSSAKMFAILGDVESKFPPSVIFFPRRKFPAPSLFIDGLFFYEKIGPSVPVTCTVNGTRYESLLRNQLIPSPPLLATPVKQLLNLHFVNDRIISRHFTTAWPPRSPDMNPCDFWLLGYLKDVVYGNPTANLAELKNRITQHIPNITIEALRSVVDYAVLRFQLIGKNGGQHIEHFLSKWKPTSFY